MLRSFTLFYHHSFCFPNREYQDQFLSATCYGTNTCPRKENILNDDAHFVLKLRNNSSSLSTRSCVLEFVHRIIIQVSTRKILVTILQFAISSTCGILVSTCKGQDLFCHPCQGLCLREGKEKNLHQDRFPSFMRATVKKRRELATTAYATVPWVQMVVKSKVFLGIVIK